MGWWQNKLDEAILVGTQREIDKYKIEMADIVIRLDIVETNPELQSVYKKLLKCYDILKHTQQVKK
jgi:uncharacterized radical SAM superfamily protein